MTLGERLRIARDRMGLKQIQVKQRTNINNKTLSGYENNVSQPDTETLVVLADLYEVSYRWLLAGKGEISSRKNNNSGWNSKLPKLTSYDEKDIAKKLESIIDELEGDTSLAFDGEPMDDDTRELVLAQIERNLRLTKQHAKQKFTPKKYRNTED